MTVAPPVEVGPAHGRPCLTLADVELWCQAMRAADARDAAPVRARLTAGGWLVRLAALPRAGDDE